MRSSNVNELEAQSISSGSYGGICALYIYIFSIISFLSHGTFGYFHNQLSNSVCSYIWFQNRDKYDIEIMELIVLL